MGLAPQEARRKRNPRLHPSPYVFSSTLADTDKNATIFDALDAFEVVEVNDGIASSKQH